MAPYDDTTPATRFDSFHIHETYFKQIGDHRIKVGILVPKDLKPGKVPLAVKFHGGGLVVGDAMFPDWLAAYWVPLVHRNNAITVLPNYRLLPEASGADILEDLANFWTWFNNKGVDKYLASQNIEPELDYEHLLVSGESAGGYMALQCGLTRPQGEIKVIHAQFPMTNHPRRKPGDLMLGQKAQSKEWLDEHLPAYTKPGAITSSSIPFTDSTRSAVSLAAQTYGLYSEWFGNDKRLWPITAVEDAKYLPPTTIFHATGDSAVAFKDSADFVEKTKKVIPGVEIRLAYGKEGEHGFDGELKEDEEPWLKEELKWIESKWLA